MIPIVNPRLVAKRRAGQQLRLAFDEQYLLPELAKHERQPRAIKAATDNDSVEFRHGRQ
jgi:hypothetical protein